MNSLDKKFRHKTWYKGEDLTVREFLDKAACNRSFSTVKRKRHINSDRLLDEPQFDTVLVCEEGRGTYKLDEEQYRYFVQKRREQVQEAILRIKERFCSTATGRSPRTSGGH